ncbi:hypothetical protein FQY83_14800 [Luteimonas marina]|uniref:Uncharacterized protein n=1 Tax=Luteimonas marina TaxID=488485 RepID=A0A5C5TZC0_9GAMM|nr:hypothetical protein [Luteimonas marina]TWT18642.1 hypothetical protein FQY83_14800 [Luteimonas marina]
MKPWLKRLQRRFSPRRIRLGIEANERLEGGESNQLLCFVGRELCLFTTIDASKVPEKQRDAFVSLGVKRAAPFPDPDYGIAWTGDRHASVWFWSRSRALERLGNEAAGKRLRFTPEALHVGSPAEDEAQLLALASGCEGRVWKQGRLVASRWWAGIPAAAAWQAFMRSAGLPPAGVPVPMDALIAPASWAGSGNRGGRLSGLSLSGIDAYLPRAAMVVAALALVVYAFQAGSIARNLFDAWSAERRAQDLDAPIKRILDAREAADANAAGVEGLLALRPGRPQLELMAEVARLIPQKGWEVRRWNQPTPDRLELTLHLPDANPEQLVSAWEASSLFHEVTTDIQPGGNTIVVRAAIRPSFGSVP